MRHKKINFCNSRMEKKEIWHWEDPDDLYSRPICAKKKDQSPGWAGYCMQVNATFNIKYVTCPRCLAIIRERQESVS